MPARKRASNRPRTLTLEKVPTPEELIHRGIVEALHVLAKPGVLYYHPPNGADIGPKQGARFKKLGLLPGVPDLVFHLPGGRTGFLEIKCHDGRLSHEQRAFRDAAVAIGCYWALVRSITEALKVLGEWNALKGGVRP